MATVYYCDKRTGETARSLDSFNAENGDYAYVNEDDFFMFYMFDINATGLPNDGYKAVQPVGSTGAKWVLKSAIPSDDWYQAWFGSGWDIPLNQLSYPNVGPDEWTEALFMVSFRGVAPPYYKHTGIARKTAGDGNTSKIIFDSNYEISINDTNITSTGTSQASINEIRYKIIDQFT